MQFRKNWNLVMASWRGLHLQIAPACGIPFGLFLSLFCTGGWLCRSLWPLSLFISFFLWGILSWPGFYMAEPQLYNHCSVCVCVCAKDSPYSLRRFEKSCLRVLVVEMGGDGGTESLASFVSKTDDKCGAG